MQLHRKYIEMCTIGFYQLYINADLTHWSLEDVTVILKQQFPN